MTRQVNKHRTAASSSSSSRASLGYEAVGLSSSSNKILEQKTYMANQYRIFSITYGSFLCLVAIGNLNYHDNLNFFKILLSYQF